VLWNRPIVTSHRCGDVRRRETSDVADTRWIPTWLCRHWPLVIVAAVASFLLLANLGADALWEDEGDTAVLAANVLKHRVPVAWDGVTFVAPDYGDRLTKSFVMISHPWLQYYVAAASFAIFGESPWAARFPFALAGLATILLVYAMTVTLVRSRLAALSAVILLSVNVQFLLFARQARNYSLHALLTCLVIWQFLRLDSRIDAVLFALSGILLFHTHPIGLAVLLALGILTLVNRSFAPTRRLFWPAAAAIGLYAAPWLVLSRDGYARNMMPIQGLRAFLPRLLQFGIECASVTPLVGLAMLSLWVRWREGRLNASSGRRHARLPAMVTDQSLAAVCLVVITMEWLVMAVTQSRQAIWNEGLHQTPSIIPLTAILTGWLVARLSASSARLWTILMLLFGLTRIPQVTPWAVGAKARVDWDPAAVVAFHMPTTLVGRFFRTTQVEFVKSLFVSNPGVITEISAFLRRNATPGDVVVTNYAWEPLYFHTHLPQASKIAPSFPIYAAVREAKLPDYVFSPTGVRWVVWRRAWPAPFAQQDLQRVLNRYRDAGLSLRLATSVPETLYENRENIHFHRFAGGDHVFAPYTNLPNTLIYRVETFDESIDHYQRELAAKPHDVEMLTDLGVALSASGRFDDAVNAFQRAAEAAPHDASAQRNLASALFDARRIVQAATHAELAVLLEPNDAGAHDVLGRVLTADGRLVEAVRQFERAVQLDPRNQEIREHLESIERLAAP
jgi:hypothetical protein